MFDTIMSVIIILLAIYGLAELTKLAAFSFFNVGVKKDRFVVLPLCGEVEEAEAVLRSAQIRAEWFGGKFMRSVIVIDTGMTQNTRTVCENICRDSKSIRLCTVNEAKELFGIDCNVIDNEV